MNGANLLKLSLPGVPRKGHRSLDGANPLKSGLPRRVPQKGHRSVDGATALKLVTFGDGAKALNLGDLLMSTPPLVIVLVHLERPMTVRSGTHEYEYE